MLNKIWIFVIIYMLFKMYIFYKKKFSSRKMVIFVKIVRVMN